jgi:hypothetical protein
MLTCLVQQSSTLAGKVGSALIKNIRIVVGDDCGAFVFQSIVFQSIVRLLFIVFEDSLIGDKLIFKGRMVSGALCWGRHARCVLAFGFGLLVSLSAELVG